MAPDGEMKRKSSSLPVPHDERRTFQTFNEQSKGKLPYVDLALHLIGVGAATVIRDPLSL